MCLDLDVLIVWIPFLLPELYVFTHRGVTHSIFISLLVSAASLYLFTHNRIITWLNFKLNLRLGTTAGLSRQTVIAAYLGALSHIFLDYSTTSGVPALFPLSINKYSAELFFYTDLIVMIFGIAIVLLLYRDREKRMRQMPFLAAFLLLILAMGGFRLMEKYDATPASASSSVYPTTNPFVWWIMEEDRASNSIYARRYDTLLKSQDFSESYPELEITASNASFSFEEALASANALPQVERFYWNAAKTSTIAIYNGTTETWLIQLKDPLRDAMITGSPGFWSFQSRSWLNVSVNKREAKVLY